ncbi:RAD9, HUS1, RAD1-interacting nuclear orphan protein 1 [Stigmatopora argus]
MPRKSPKTAKPSLLFAEPPVSIAKLPSSPEIRAALHPKVFFTEKKASTNLTSWVNPQFDTSLGGAVPWSKSGHRRKRRLGTIIQDTCSILSKKTTSKFPPLSFQSNGHHHPAKKSHRSCAAGSAEIPPKQKHDDDNFDDAPKEGNGRTPSSLAFRLLAGSSTPPHCQPLDVLVPDTPEKYYGLNVTWRRRLWVMTMLEERGQLTECQKFIRSKN